MQLSPAITSLCFTFVLTITCSADQPSPSFRYVTSSSSGGFYFEMNPGTDSTPPTGTMYEVASVGSNTTLWTVSGWHSNRVFVADGGVSLNYVEAAREKPFTNSERKALRNELKIPVLVRLGNWPEGRKPNKGHVAVAFYSRGKLIRSYSTADLIPKHRYAEVPRSVSHYEFHSSVKLLDDTGSTPTLYLKSSVGDEFWFNCQTGEISKQR